MISRRTFVLTTLAVSAGSLAGCFRRESAKDDPRVLTDRAKLELYFVGGTVFRKVASDTYVAVQLSGKGVEHDGRAMEHRSYMVADAGTFGAEARRFPADYRMSLLHPSLTKEGTAYEAVCLVGKDIRVSHRDGKAIEYRCQEVAHYGHVASGWAPKGQWDPSNEPAINSRFTLTGGELVDAPAVNQKGYAARWRIATGDYKTLSDVAKLVLEASSISLEGISSTPVTVESGQALTVYVFSGPVSYHTGPHRYRQITHALLLKTIYDVKGTPDADIMPTSETEFEDEAEKLPHPCDLEAGPQDTKAFRAPVPPDSEYCPNYQELP